jgi:hypothetical protein
MLFVVIVVTVLIAESRGMEASSIGERQDRIEERVAAFEAKPLVQSKYTTVYAIRGGAEVETDGK